VQCSARSKQSGERCKKDAVRGREVCHIHGGRSPRGPASATWKDGTYSKYMQTPEKLREGYERALSDPQLTHHRTSIALTDALIEELLESYDAGANPETWKAVKAEYNKMRVANASGDRHKAREHFEALGLLINEGASHAEQSTSILRALEARGKHAERETKRKLSESISFSYEAAYTFYSSMGAAARKHFGHDRERLSAFINEITAISGEHGLEDQDDQRVLPPET
jgi:hypothetical protein